MSNAPETKEKKTFTEKYAELWKFIKFSFAGAISTLIELGIYYLLVYTVFKNSAGEKFVIVPGTLEWDAKGVFWAFVISTTIGYIIAFLLNRKTTFKADSNVVVSAILYTLMVIFTIFATAFIGAWFMDLLKGMGHEEIGKTVGKPLAAALATVWTYPLNRFVIHRHKKEEPKEEAVEEEEVKPIPVVIVNENAISVKVETDEESAE